MKRELILLNCLLWLHTLNGQQVNFSWVKQMGGQNSWSASLDLATDDAGNIYFTGHFNGTIDADPGPGSLIFTSIETDGIVVKLDAAGNLLWARQFGGPDVDIGYSIALDNEGNVCVTGTFEQTCNFNMAGIPYSLTANDLKDGFITKYTASGTHLWTKQITGKNIQHPASICTDASGNIFTTGLIYDTTDVDPGPGIFHVIPDNLMAFYLLKQDKNGDFLWAINLGMHEQGNTVVKTDAAGNVYVSGSFSGSHDFDPGPGSYLLQSTGFIDNFVVKYTSGGAIIWAKIIGGNNTAIVSSFDLAVSPLGNIYITGDFMETIDFDPGAGNYPITSFSNYDIFVLKLTTNGSFVWAKQMGGSWIETGLGITIDAAENVYTTGGFRAESDFDPGICVYNLAPRANGSNTDDIFISKLDVNGNFLWARAMGGDATDIGWGIGVGSNGSIITSGFFSLSADFDPAAPVYTVNAMGNNDLFVHKLSPCTNGSTASVVINACAPYIINCQTLTTPGIYTLNLLNSQGCDSIVTIDFRMDGMIAGDSSSATSCGAFNWQGQTLTSSGIYRDTLQSSGGCDSIVILNLTINPKYNYVIRDTICEGETLFGYTATGVYTDSFATTWRCDSIRVLELLVYALPNPELGVDADICEGDSLVLSPGNFNTYQWQDGSSNAEYKVLIPGTYRVTVSNDCGVAEDAIIVREENCDVWFPNVFTPNGDGRNELFKMLGRADPDGFKLSVFNRWGEVVFQTTDMGKGWNGRTKNKDVQPGMYVWICNYKKDGKINHKKGVVMVVR